MIQGIIGALFTLALQRWGTIPLVLGAPAMTATIANIIGGQVLALGAWQVYFFFDAERYRDGLYDEAIIEDFRRSEFRHVKANAQLGAWAAYGN
jgi:hypothetical protein